MKWKWETTNTGVCASRSSEKSYLASAIGYSSTSAWPKSAKASDRPLWALRLIVHWQAVICCLLKSQPANERRKTIETGCADSLAFWSAARLKGADAEPVRCDCSAPLWMAVERLRNLKRR